ncbi:hypothetical protein DESC_740032 [Desulfosarcina cetonica]|nr:hypothetical protein DESC_740032 [Desulfosarcina cetonica]
MEAGARQGDPLSRPVSAVLVPFSGNIPVGGLGMANRVKRKRAGGDANPSPGKQRPAACRVVGIAFWGCVCGRSGCASGKDIGQPRQLHLSRRYSFHPLTTSENVKCPMTNANWWYSIDLQST